jgi:two-component system response regulator HydG
MRAEDLKSSEMFEFDPKTGLPFFGQFRIMLFGLPAMARLQKDVINSLGREKAEKVLGRIGYENGLAAATVIRELYDFKNAEEWMRAGAHMLKMSGVAVDQTTEVSVDPEKKHFYFKGDFAESVEALLWRTDHPEDNDWPVCFFMQGLASGFASAVMGTEVLIRETACRAQGHAVCTLEGRTVEAWGLDPGEVRQIFQLDLLENEIHGLRSALDQVTRDLARRNRQIRKLQKRGDISDPEPEIVFRSESMGGVLFLADKVAPSGATVLIEGESGTGKERLARFIHQRSNRRDSSFVAVNCAALPPNLLESELFGHVKGAFTGADQDKRGLFFEAGEGTILLDELGELPLEIQVKLLRALEEKEVRPVGGLKSEKVRARILVATNRNLKELVKSGAFREDLYYRIAVFPIRVPPLRERREDILPLARHFLRRLRAEHPGFSPAVVRQMERYGWPGNVRELENWMEYAVILAGDDRIRPDHLPLASEGSAESLRYVTADLPSLRELERRYIQVVLDRTRGNKTEAAQILGTSVTTLWRRLRAATGEREGI